MHMETCGLIAESIVGIDNDIVSFGDVKWRDRPLSVDTNDRSTIFGARRRLWVDPRNVEVVCDCSGKRSECEQDERCRWQTKIGGRNRHYRWQNFIDRRRGNISGEFSKLLALRKSHSNRLYLHDQTYLIRSIEKSDKAAKARISTLTGELSDAQTRWISVDAARMSTMLGYGDGVQASETAGVGWSMWMTWRISAYA